MLLAGALLRAAFWLFDWPLEQYAWVLWLGVVISATLVGMGVGLRWGVVPGRALLLATLIVSGVWAGLTAWVTPGGFSSAPVRALFVAPATIGLCAYFGASLGYLWHGRALLTRLGYEAFIGRRFLLSKASPVLSTVTAISVVGVALGVWLVTVSLGILSGFESDLENKIIGANAHVVLQRTDLEPFALTDGMLQTAQRTDGVLAASPYLEGEVAVASSSNYTAGLLVGIDPALSPKVLDVLNNLKRGDLPQTLAAPAKTEAEFAPAAPLPGMVIGVEMAKALSVDLGDHLRVISPSLEVLTPLGVAPRTLTFRVDGVFSSKMYEFDARYAYVTLPAARRFFELSANDVSGLQVKTAEPDFSEATGAALAKHFGPGFSAKDWKQRNQTLFASLKLERVVAFVVLVFIILVASFSIVNTLTMSVIEKRREIAILKTMGARDVGIMKLFLVQGLLVGGCGTLLGALMAWGTVVGLQRFRFWIPGDVYYIDALPVNLQASDMFVVVLAALLIVWDFAVFPSLRGARLTPVEGLRDG